MQPSPVVGQVAAALTLHPPAPRYWIAFSGGIDSTALIHVCHRLNRSDTALNFAVAHVHHGLQPAADQWVAHARTFCRTLAFPLTVRYVDASPRPGESPEAAARRARYAALQQLMAPGDVLLTAQHQDDQAETLLLQLLRGAGPAGLAAMPAWTAFGPGFLCRPLLAVPRSRLLDYAIRHKLRWVDDPGNGDRRFDRNYLRHEILPRLQRRWPSLATTIARTACHCAEADTLLNELGAELLARVGHPERMTLRVKPLAALSVARQRLVLRTWIRNCGLRPPPSGLIERALQQMVAARRDRHPEVAWRDASIRRHRGELYLINPLPRFDPARTVAWTGGDAMGLPDDNGRLTARLESGPGIAPPIWGHSRIEVRYRRGGETLTLPRRQGTRTLKKLLQDSDIPPWARERLPLIYLDGRLAAVADRYVAAPFAGDPTGVNVRLHWTQPVFTVSGPAIGGHHTQR